jgi:type II secretory pathway pseudopilin PulG
MSRNAPRNPARAEFRAEIRAGRARVQRTRVPRRQRGFVLVLVLTLVVVATLWGITTSLVTAAKRTDRNRATMAAIMQAKDALIAHSALYLSRPGSLPCPATSTSGAAGIACTAFGPPQPNAMVGRFPWSTLGLPELRDANGEPLWYAVSPDFRRVSGLVVNSETRGQLDMDGLAPARRVVAVIIAPGAVLGGQNRDPSVAANLTNVANYLEGENNYLDPAFDNGTNNYRFANATESGTFNDVVVPITEEELFAAVENMIALRLRNDVKPLIDAEYRDFWRAYPFPAAFGPATGPLPGFIGVVGASEGQLPIDSNQIAYSWTSFDASVVLVSGGSISSSLCTMGAATSQCDVDVASGNPTIRVSGVASNAGLSFAKYDVNPVTATVGGLLGSSATGSLDASGNGTITFDVTLSGLGLHTIVFPKPEANPKLTRGTTTAGAGAQFFFSSDWYRLVYYAASPGALPGGPLACTLSNAAAAKLPAPCPLGVDPLYQPLGTTCPGSPQPLPAACIARVRADGSREEGGVMLVLAGRAMLVAGTPQTRPTALLADYLEDAKNLNSPVLAPREFEQKPRVPTFNDRVVVLAP